MDTTIEVDDEDGGWRPGNFHIEWMTSDILIGLYTQDDGKLVIIQTYVEIDRLRFRSDPERTIEWIVCPTIIFYYCIVDLC